MGQDSAAHGVSGDRKRRRWPLLVVVVMWLACVAAAWPVGDFPMNDDWSFGGTAKTFVETGRFRPSGWTGMPLLSQVIWGSLFCLPCGFSFEALRLSTICLSVVGIVATYLLVEKASGSPAAAALSAAMLAFNPIYFALSNTFMTDVPFTATLAVTACCLSQTIRAFKPVPYAAGVLMAVAATLDRQLGLAVPIAYGIMVVARRSHHDRASLVQAVLPAAASALALALLEAWMRAADVMPALYHLASRGLVASLLSPTAPLHIARNGVVATLYLGLFLAPMLVLCAADTRTRPRPSLTGRNGLSVIAGGAFAGLVVLWLVLTARTMPLGKNVLFTGGIGRAYMVGGDPPPSGVMAALWLAWTVAAIAGGSVLAAIACRTILSLARDWRSLADASRTCSEPGRHDAALLGFLSTVVYLAPLCIHGFFDRYLIPAVPLLATWISSFLPRPSREETWFGTWRSGLAVANACALVLLASFGLYSTLGTRDLFAWNRARWNLLANLIMTRDVTPRRIDGGFEFNGLHLYDPAYKPRPGKSWWWVEDDEYVVSFSTLDGYDVIDRRALDRLLPPSPTSVLLLRRAMR